MKNNRFISFLLISWIACVICGCMGGSGSQSNGTAPSSDGLTLSITPTLELATNNSSLITALLINNTNKSIDTISFSSNDSHLLVLGNGCSILLPGESCKVNLQLNAEKDNDGYLLQAHGKDGSGQEYETQQLFSYTSFAAEESNLINQAIAANNRVVSKSGELFALAIPFTKNSADEDITSSLGGLDDIVNQETVCSDTNKTQCTLIAIGRSSKSESITVKLSANNVVFYSTTVNILAASRGNLVSSSSNVTVSPADGESFTSFTLFNNGSESVTGIKPFATNHPAIESQISFSGCGGTLNSGESCAIQVKVNSAGFGNGALPISITYNTTLKANGGSQAISDKISLWLYYLNNSNISPGLSLTYTGGFIDNQLGQTSNGNFTVTNTGNVDLSNIQLTKQTGSFTIKGTSSCLNNTLAVGQSCQFVVSYTSIIPQQAYVNVMAAASYKDSANVSRSIVSNQEKFYYNTNPSFAFFGRWDNDIAGFDSATFDVNGWVSYKNRSESSTGSPFTKDDQPETIQPMYMFDGSMITYVLNNSSGDLYSCPTNRLSGVFTSACTSVYSNSTSYGLHVFKYSVAGTNSVNRYLYLGAHNYLGSEASIGACPISESGVLTTGKCTFFTGGANTAALMFDESRIYAFGKNVAKVCSINSADGTGQNCSDLKGSIATIATSAYFNSLVMVVANDSNGNKARYVYLSDVGDYSEGTAKGRIIGCTLAKNTTTGILDFNNCTAIVANMTGLRGLEVVSIESKNYLYYTNNQQGSGLFSRQILAGGGLGTEIAQTSFKSQATSTFIADQMYVLHLPDAYFKYDKYVYTVARSSTTQINVKFVGSGTIGSSRIFFTNSRIPNSITFNQKTAPNLALDFAVESGFDTQTINVNVGSSVSPGDYSLTGTSNNGVSVPDVTIRVI